MLGVKNLQKSIRKPSGSSIAHGVEHHKEDLGLWIWWSELVFVCLGFFLMSQETNLNDLNEGTKGGFADTAIYFLVSIQGFGRVQVLFGETYFVQTLNSSSHVLEKASNHKFTQKWCPVAFVTWFHLLPYSWEILKACEGRLESYYHQSSPRKTWKLTVPQMSPALSSIGTFWEPR